MEGFLIRLTSEAKLKNLEINQELVQSLLGKGAEPIGKTIKSNPNEVISAVSKFFSIGKRALLGESRARPVSLPRQILMYLLRTYLNLPLEEVGRLIGGRDHTTVMHAVEKITNMVSTNVQIREDILGIKNLL
jgi:chromosomal replication initiator protein